MDLGDLVEFSDFFPTWQSLLWTVLGIVAGFATYRVLRPWEYAAWVAIIVGFAVLIGGRAWHARRDSNKAASRKPE